MRKQGSHGLPLMAPLRPPLSKELRECNMGTNKKHTLSNKATYI